MGAKNSGAVQAVLLVACIMLVGYLVGAASVDAISAWWGTMPV
jgi:hypothetical protein